MSDWNDAAAERFAGSHGDDPTEFALVGAAVPEIGCGTGFAWWTLPALAGPLTGVDPIRRMIDPAQRQTRGVGARALPLAGASGDAVLAIDSMHHRHDAAPGLAKVFPALRQGGGQMAGGGKFDSAMGVDQTRDAVLAAAGFGQVSTRDIPHGFMTGGRKPEAAGV